MLRLSKNVIFSLKQQVVVTRKSTLLVKYQQTINNGNYASGSKQTRNKLGGRSKFLITCSIVGLSSWLVGKYYLNKDVDTAVSVQIKSKLILILIKSVVKAVYFVLRKKMFIHKNVQKYFILSLNLH